MSTLPRLLVLSDLWGTRKMDWFEPCKVTLEGFYEVVFLDSRKLAGISEDISNEKAIHHEFINGGIETAVDELVRNYRECSTIFGVSVGGTIGWRALNSGLKAKHFHAISATRLRFETKKPQTSIQLYYGEDDLNRPKDDWFEELDISCRVISGGHDIYQTPLLIQFVSNQIWNQLPDDPTKRTVLRRK